MIRLMPKKPPLENTLKAQRFQEISELGAVADEVPRSWVVDFTQSMATWTAGFSYSLMV